MAYYTALLKDVCEALAFYAETDYDKVIPIARPKIFTFSYEFWNPDAKVSFEELFLKHFYMRELGFENYALWKLRLDDKFNTALPYYNKLYAALAKEYDPLITDIESIDIERGHTKDNTNQNHSESDSTSDSTINTTNNRENTHSELPMGELTNFRNNTYLSDASKVADNGTNVGHATGSVDTDTNGTAKEIMSGTEKHTIKGTHSDQSALIRSYLDAQRNITMEFFKECDDLFMELWG